jgi:N-acetylneuraminate synthase/N,N'-diacetyllegionaminate synthase
LTNRVEIGGRIVGDGESCFIIAEAGVNHGGSIDCAKRLIDKAKLAGSDAVKFQIFNAEEMVTEQAEKAEYQKNTTDQNESQYNMIKKLELDDEEFRELARYAKERGILFLSTPFSTKSADVLEDIGVPAYKIASGEITNLPLLEHIARKGKPIILSTGMSTLEEISEALKHIKEAGENEIVILHCVTSYPARPEEINLRAIGTLRRAFSHPTGLSDHSLGIAASIAAVALGACVIEKHFTLDRNLPGPDHKASLQPDELKEMIEAIRVVEKAMGDGIKQPSAEEEKIKQIARKSVVAGTNILPGTIITEDMLKIKRPGTGIAPKDIKHVIGKIAKEAIIKDTIIKWDMITS